MSCGSSMEICGTSIRASTRKLSKEIIGELQEGFLVFLRH